MKTTELDIILLDNHIISDESKEKVCIITDLVAMGKLIDMPIPNWYEFCEMYDADLRELELMQYAIMREIYQLPQFGELKSKLDLGWDGTSTDF